MVEFVSANPTGPLHVGHGRQAALGDALAALLESQGHEVTREFYYNDAGAQIQNLALSVQARARASSPAAWAGLRTGTRATISARLPGIQARKGNLEDSTRCAGSRSNSCVPSRTSIC